jgi:hypothetical protein
MKNMVIDKPKNKKKALFTMAGLAAIALVIVIAVNFIMWKNYGAKQIELDSLKAEVIQVKEQAANVVAPPSGLETTLETAKINLANALQIFPENIDRNDVVDFILKTAANCTVSVIPLESEGWTIASGQPYQVLSYRSTVTGTLNDTSVFMTKLHGGIYPTMMIKDCTITRTPPLYFSVPEDKMLVSIDMKINLYAVSVKSG